MSAALLSAPVCLVASASASAADTPGPDIPPGTTIDAENFPTLQTRPFGGHPLGAEVAPRIGDHIRADGLRLHVVGASAPVQSNRLAAATKSYSGSVSLDPATNMIKGWKAGIPFPVLDPADPQLARKVIWNVVLGQPAADGEEWPRVATLALEDKAGLTGYQFWKMRRFRFRGRLVGPATIGDGRILDRLLVLGLYPAEIKFVGTLTTRFATGAFPRTELSMRGLGLTMDLPADSWQADIEGTVQAGDDTGIFNAFPTWYTNYKLLGRRPILVPARSAGSSFAEDDRGGVSFPRFAIATAPHWTPVDDWELRDVYVVDATAPKTHRYSRKIVYVDAQTWQPYLAEAYDRTGDPWRTLIQGYGVRPLGGGDSASLPVWGITHDRKSQRASAWVLPDEAGPITNVTEKDVEESVLKSATE